MSARWTTWHPGPQPRGTLGNLLTPPCSRHKDNCLPRRPFVGPPRRGWPTLQLCAPGPCARVRSPCSVLVAQSSVPPPHTQNPPGSLPTKAELHWLLAAGSTKQETNAYPLATGVMGPSIYHPLSIPSPALATHG